GELDWIVMKALEKDRDRRYETANGFATDVRHYLADEPVLACPPSAGYRFRKFVRRHRLLLATTAAFAGLLVAAPAVATRAGAAATWLAVWAIQAEVGEADQRRIAEQNERVATGERNKALAALEAERFTSYTHRVALAHREWLAGEVDSARQLLEGCPADLRD